MFKLFFLQNKQTIVRGYGELNHDKLNKFTSKLATE